MEFKKGLRTPTLLGFIQNILNQYPDDGQILKELIQNADDAGAETVKFLLDERPGHHIEHVSHPGLAEFQGAALYSYNDAAFTEEDWKGICQMHESIKRNDPIKTGRFGLGFKSVFHITDLPIILSGDYVGFIDPHQVFLPDKTSAHPWHLAEESKEIARFWDQFKSLSKTIFNSEKFQNEKHYAHTLFRFPLRTKASELSKRLYTPEQIDNLFHSLIVDEGQSLLFLKSVCSIEIYKHKMGEDVPILVHKTTISKTCQEHIKQIRARFLNQIENRKLWMTRPVKTFYKMTIDVESWNDNHNVVTAQHEWMVVHRCGTNGLKAVEELADELGVLPWIGLALSLQGTKASCIPMSSCCGRLFASLPLPLDGTEDTGLPFHIHGFFGMEQNRRHLKWPTADQSVKNICDPSLRWNQVLVSELIPIAMLEFLSAIIQSFSENKELMSSDDVYASMPDEDYVDQKWKPVTSYLYQRLFNMPSLYTPVNGGRWLLPSECYMIMGEMSLEQREAVADIILKSAKPLALPPAHVLKALTCYCQIPPKEVTPNMVKHAILSSQKESSLPQSSALTLLKYFHERTMVCDLIGLPLIPLKNKEMEIFQAADAERIYMTSVEHPSTLLPMMEGQMIETELDKVTKDILLKIAKTGHTQVEMLSAKSVLKLLPEVEPSECSKQDIMLIGNGFHTKEWIEEVWCYLQNHRSMDMELWGLRNLHILPVSPTELCRLGSGKKVMFRKKNCHIPDSVLEFLTNLDVVVLFDAPDYVHSNEILTSQFLQPCSIEGVINVLQIQEENHQSSLVEAIRNLWRTDKHLVQEFVDFLCDSGVALLSATSKSFLKRLPIFSTFRGSGFTDSAYVSVSEVSISAPQVELPVDFPTQAIEITTTGIQHLLETLGVSSFHSSKIDAIFREKLHPEFQSSCYTSDQLSHITVLFLDHFEKDFRTDTKLFGKMKNTKCIPNRTGEMFYPSDFFDPREPFLKDLLGEDDFPPDVFNTQARLSVLCSLGLQTIDCIQPSKVIRIAQSMTENFGKEAIFLEFLEHLCERMEYRENKEFWQTLAEIPFLPVVQRKPSWYPPSLTWHGENVTSHLSCAVVYHIAEARSLGAIFPMVDIKRSLLKHLKPKEVPPSVEDLVLQLKLVKENFRPEEKMYYMPLVDEIYDELSKFNALSLQEALNNHSFSEWVWYGEGFKPIERLLLEKKDIDLSPHVVLLPPEMTRHQEFFRSCGLTDEIDPGQVLAWISETYAQGHKKGIEEVQHDLKLANKILRFFAKDLCPNVLVPVKTYDQFTLHFCPATECTRKTASDALSLMTDIDGVNYVHPSVPKNVCDTLLIRTDISRGADSEALGVEACGQSESLTNRLRSIIEGYTDGLAFITEMVQNADDAGATEVQLIYDKRKNEDHCYKILDQGMKSWQGPAFWLYNDAKFTEDDFRSIAKLNGATKAEKHDKIGTFGLGFNAVYNVTDVPSFLSGNRMVIFDPHTKYLNDALVNKSIPGIQLKTANSRTNVLEAFSDQFAPWNGVCGCNLKEDMDAYFQGTLFRLPLRGRSESHCSEISKTVYSENDIQTLFGMIQEQSDKMLLFTQTVSKFSVAIIPEDAVDVLNDQYQIFSIMKEPVSYLQKHEIEVPVSANGNKEFMTQTSILKAAKICKTSPIMSTIVLEMNLKFTHQGGSYHGRGTAVDNQSTWLITNYFEPSNTQSGSKPLTVAGVAIQLVHGEVGLVVKPLVDDNDKPRGSYFCFLPLPVDCKLPMHLNGTFCLENSRRHLMTKTEHDRISEGGEWNQNLIQKNVCPAIVHALNEAVNLVSVETDLYSLLPVENDGLLVNSLTQTFWELLMNGPSSPPIFKGQGKWVRLENALFLEPGCFGSNESLRSIAKKVINDFHSGSNKVLVDVPSSILEVLWKTNQAFMKKKSISEEVFFIDYFLCEISNLQISTEERDSLLLYGLKTDSKKMDAAFSLLPSVPACGGNHIFLRPKELIHPYGKAAVLYGEHDQKFPQFSVGDEASLTLAFAKLCSLGMMKDLLAWKDVLERAEDIAENMADGDGQKPKLFIKYLDWRLCCGFDTVPEDIQNSLALTRFLTAKQQPEQWNSAWKGDRHKLYCGREMLWIEECLIGCCQYAIPSEDLGITDEIALLLNMKATITLPDIARQLQIIASQCDERTALVKRSISLSYAHLEKCCHSDDEAVKIKDLMSKKKLVYIENEDVFVYPTMCSFELNFKASPYLFFISAKSFPIYYKTLGVTKQFQPKDYIGTLADIKTEAGDMPLNRNLLDLVINILQQLQRQMQAEGLKLASVCKFGVIYMPDTRSILYPAGKMTYHDCPWVKTDLPYLMTNKDITYDVAKCLGAKDIRSRLLSHSSRSLGTPFGQKERLVDRIKSVLRAYPYGTQMLMEFAQNADDAGATELHFILDERSYGKDRVFGPKWTALQGPALCVYNNANFTAADLEGIIAVGRGSKKDDPGKIGQYGVGLNAAYHISDVQILRVQMEDGSERLIALDPSCQYVPGASHSEPGRLYDDLDDLRNVFPDVFSCLMEDKYKNGTFFRLPLHIANAWTISSQFRGVGDIDRLLQTFREACFETLLFLTSLKEIHITKVDQRGTFHTDYVKAFLSEDHQEELSRFRNALHREATTHKEGLCDLSSITTKNVSYSIELVGKDKSERWNVVQQCGSEQPLPDDVSHYYSRLMVPALPVGGAASLCSRSSQEYRSEPESRKVFSSLPLPIETILPVHINGHFMLDNESRQHLWGGWGDEYKTLWNKFLCENVIAPCYANCILMKQQEVSLSLNLLEHNQDRVDDVIVEYYKVFPDQLDSQQCYEVDIIQRVCRLIAHKDCIPVRPYYHGKIKWVSLEGDNSGYFYESEDDSDELCMYRSGTALSNNNDTESILVAELCSIDGVLCPNERVKNVFEQNLDIKFFGPSSLIEMLKLRYVNFGKTPTIEMNHIPLVLRYCMKDEDFAKKMDGLPLLLTSDGKLGVFSNRSPVFKSEYTDLVRFPSDEFLHQSCIAMFEDTECDVFKDFRIVDFAQHFVALYPDLVTTYSDALQWDPKLISKETLNRIWKFITSDSEAGRNIQVLDDICLLRVKLYTWPQKTLLFPLRLAYTILSSGSTAIDVSQVDVSNLEHSCLSKLSEPRFVETWLNSCQLLANWLNPSSIAKAFLYYQMTGNEPNPYSARQLLDYFSRQGNRENLSSAGIDDLKQLKIFQTHDLKLTTGIGNIYAIPVEVPREDMDSWKDSKSSTFLIGEKKYKQLYELLGFCWMNIDDLYKSFIIPQIELGFIQKGYWVHVFFIMRNFSDLHYLEHAQIVKSTGDALHKASELFDSQVELFIQMEEEDQFPKKVDKDYPSADFLLQFNWTTFLKKIGLIHEASAEMIRDYAWTLSEESLENSEQNKKWSVLLMYIKALNKKEALHSLHLIKNIAFIPPKINKKFQCICPYTSECSQLNTLSRSVMKCHADIAWSVAPVLEDISGGLYEGWKRKDLKSVGVITKPSCWMVIQHLKNISKHNVNKGSDLSDDLQAVLERCFTFLKNELKENEGVSEIISSLYKCPCVLLPEAKILLSPRFVFLGIEDCQEIRPYLWKVPQFMKPFQCVLKAIRCAEQPVVCDYQEILKHIFDVYGTQCLDSRTQKASLQTMMRILESDNVDLDENVPLYLLSDSGEILDATKLVFNNNSSISQRLSLKMNLKFLHAISSNAPVELLLERLPESHRPQKLTSLVKEVLYGIVPTKRVVDKAQEIEKKLHTSNITQGVQRLAMHSAFHRKTYGNTEYFKGLANEICAILQNIKIVTVSHLNTVLEDMNGKKCGSVEEVMIYIDDSTSTLYVRGDMWEKDKKQTCYYFWMLLAEMIDERMGGLFQEDKHKLMVILAEDDMSTEKLLDLMKIAK